MRRRLAQLAWFIGFMIFVRPAIEHGLGGQTVERRFEHHFAVPDTNSRVAAYLPLVSEYLPNEDYDRWWHELAECEGLSLPVDYMRVRFYQINAPKFYDQDRPSLFWKNGILYAHWAVGQTYVHEPAIFVAITHNREEIVVKHEMLHLLLYWNAVPPGKNGHPMPFFGRCGMTVTYTPPPSG